MIVSTYGEFFVILCLTLAMGVAAGMLIASIGVSKVEALVEKENMASQDLIQEITALQTELGLNASTQSAAIALINGFSAQLNAAIASASDDTAAVASLKDVIAHFQTNDAALAAAVASGTGPTPPSVPAPIVTPAAPTAPPAS